MVLYEEQPVITKRIVPEERVRLVKTSVTDQQKVKSRSGKRRSVPNGPSGDELRGANPSRHDGDQQQRQTRR